MLGDALNAVVLKGDYRSCPCQQRSLQNGCVNIHLETILSQIRRDSFFLPSHTHCVNTHTLHLFLKKFTLMEI